MPMTRNERIMIHKKQERSQIKIGAPSSSELKEGVPEFRKTNEGVVEYVRFKDVLHKKKLTPPGEKIERITKLTDSTGGSVSNTLNDTTSSVKDDLAALASKINEIIVKIN